jgi:Carboxypeptidase regulatory-like domain
MQSRRTVRFFGFTAAVLFLLSLANYSAFAQQTFGNIRGVVRDQASAVIPNAAVTLTNQGTTESYKTTSGGDGQFQFNNLLVGDYTIRIEAAGFQALSLKDVRVQLNQTTDVPAALTAGLTGETVEVSASGLELVQTTTTNLTKSFDARQTVELPQTTLGGGVYNLALLAANVSSGGGVGVGTGGSIGGQRARNNNFVVDGIDNNDKSVTGPSIYISNESVSEFSLLTNQFSAEFNRSNGGQFLTVTKSGSNDWHGTGFGYFQNRYLNALDVRQIESGFVRERNVAGTDFMPRYDYGRFGGNFSGPIYVPRFGMGGSPYYSGKDKAFFFFQFERSQTGSAATPLGVTTPTAAGFATLNAIPGLSATNLAIFNRFVPVAATADDTISVLGRTIPVGPASFAAPSFNNQNNLVANVDYNQSDKTQHRVRFIYNRYREIDNSATLPAFYTNRPVDGRLFSYTFLHSFTPRVNYELRLAYRRSLDRIVVPDIPFPGLDIFPNIGLGDLGLDIGPNPVAPQFGIENNYQLVSNVSWQPGNHSFKVGVDTRRIISPQSFVQRQRGDYQYNSTEQFLLDRSPDGLAERTVGESPYYGNQWLVFPFAQDEWRFRPNWTLTAGVAYSYQQLPFGARQQSLNAISSVPGFIDFREPKAQKRNFGPRIGLAYAPNFSSGMLGKFFGNNNQTSIRAGFTMAYDVIFDNLYILSLPPQFNQTRDVDPSANLPGFLAGGGISPTPTGGLTNAADARAVTTSFIPDQKVPYSLSYSLSVQRQFARDFAVEARYLGTRGVHLLSQNRLNAISRVEQSSLPVFFTAPTAAQAGALNLTLGQIQQRPLIAPAYAAAGFDQQFLVGFLSNGYSTYDAGSVQLTKRLSRGVDLISAYTFSKFIDNSTAELFSTVLSPRRAQDFQNITNEKGLSAYHRPHRFTFGGNFEFPFFRIENRVLRALLGFTISPVYTYERGGFATVRSGVDANLNGDTAGDRAFYNPNGTGNTASDVFAIDRTATVIPFTLPDGRPNPNLVNTVAYVANNSSARFVRARPGTQPNLGRNAFLRLDDINNWDISVKKNFAFTEMFKVQIRADFINAFNHAQFVPGSVSTVLPVSTTGLAATAFNQIGLNPANFGRSENVFSSNPRVVQLALRLTF